MPALQVTLDGARIATVNTDGLDVVSINVGGTQVDDEFATLNVSGGSYPEGRPSTYLTWISDQTLHPGQRIHVSFLESGASSHVGRTVEELFPNEAPSPQPDFTPTSEIFDEVRSRPKQRETFSFRFISSTETSFVGTTGPEEHGFGFSVLWNSTHPERARASLHSYTLDSLQSRGPMKDHVKEQMTYGNSIELEFVA